MPLDDSASPAEPPAWRDHVHPAADLFPVMADDELRELGRDILANGLQQPLAWCGDQLLDGRNRLAAVEIAAPPDDRARLIRLMLTGGIDPDLMVSFPPPRVLPAEDDPVAYVVSANLHRRHLSGEQKRDVIAGLLKAHPEWSDRRIGRATDSDGKTIAAARSELEGRAEIPHVETRTDSIGREQPATKPGPPTFVPPPPPQPAADRPAWFKPEPEQPAAKPAGLQSGASTSTMIRFSDLEAIASEAIRLANKMSEALENENLVDNARDVLIELALSAHNEWLQIANNLKRGTDRRSHIGLVEGEPP